MKKNLVKIFIITCLLMLNINTAYATTIKETTVPGDGYDTIANGTIVVGITKFNPGITITGYRAAIAGSNFGKFELAHNLSDSLKILVYAGVGGWYQISEGGTTLKYPAPSEVFLYYVNNVEKKIEVNYSGNNGTLDISSIPNGINYSNGIFTVPSTQLEFSVKNTSGAYVDFVSTPYSVNNKYNEEVRGNTIHYFVYGKPLKNYVVLNGEKTVKPDDPTLGTNIFVKWLDGTNGQEYTFGNELTSDINLNAIFSGNSTIIVDSNNGSSTYNITDVLDATTFNNNIDTVKNKLLTPIKDGYTFKDWYTTNTNGTLTDAFDPKLTTVSNGMTLYAGYTENSYTLNFTNSGDLAIEPMSLTYTQQVNLADFIPGKVGFDFMGWATEENGSVVYAKDAVVKELTPTDAGTATLYGVWHVKDYNITYNLDGGTATNPATYRLDSADFTLANPTKSGYVFLGWTGSNGDTPETTITIIKGTTGDLTYTANWALLGDVNNDGEIDISDPPVIRSFLAGNISSVPSKEGADVNSDGEITDVDSNIILDYLAGGITSFPYKDTVSNITYNLDGGTATNRTSYSNYNSTFSLSNPIKTGYIFTGWTGSNGNTLEKNIKIEIGTTGDLTYTANWTLAGDVNNDNSVDIDDIIKLNGYINKTITTMENASAADVNNDGNITEEDLNILSKYVAKTEITSLPYKDTISNITYNLDGGAATNRATYSNYSSTFTLNNPTKTNYIFLGWTGSNGDTPQTKISIKMGTIGDLTYTANWTLAGDVNNDNSVNGIDVTLLNRYISKITTIMDNEVAADVNNDGNISEEDLNILSKYVSSSPDIASLPYKDIVSNITYNLDGGTATNRATYSNYSSTFTLNNPTKANYIFKGWTGSNSTTPQTNVTINEGTTGDLTYTANWLLAGDLNSDGSVNDQDVTILHQNLQNLPEDISSLKAGDVIVDSKITIEDEDILSEYLAGNISQLPCNDIISNITYNLDGGTATNRATYSNYTKSFTLENPTKVGYKFDGWTGSNGKIPENTITINKGTTGNLTYTANWGLDLTSDYYTGSLNFTLTSDDLEKSTNKSANLMTYGDVYIDSSSVGKLYNVYIDIESNNFGYTTTAKTPEILLTIGTPTIDTYESGITVNEINGLNYVTSGLVSGFDITNKTGKYTIAENVFMYNDLNKSMRVTWPVKITYVNLGTDKSSNIGKEIKVKLGIVESSIAESSISASSSIQKMASTKSNLGGVTAITHQATGNQTYSTTEYRYNGSNPNNYVTFNDELWRIIGVFEVENESGQKENRVKIIRNEAIGNYSYDTSINTINSGFGINEWSQADLMRLLNPGYESNQDLNDKGSTITVNNSLYWNKGSGTCYYFDSNTTIACDFTSTGLGTTAKSMIDKAKYYLGGFDSDNITTNSFYEKERGSNVVVPGTTCNGTNCNDTITRTTTWTGYVGLPYYSDYGYSASDNSCYNNTNLKDYISSGCKGTSWIDNSWLITPFSNYSNRNFYLITGMFFADEIDSSYNFSTSPVVYLKSSIKITGGSGTATNPYTLSL
jgi:uncharacterized repeat protein (TIGR02543 family)